MTLKNPLKTGAEIITGYNCLLIDEKKLIETFEYFRKGFKLSQLSHF